MNNITVQKHDLLEFEDLLKGTERHILHGFRNDLSAIDNATLTRGWETGEFPRSLVAPLAESGQLGRHLSADPPSHLLRGFLTAELARKDASLATFAGVTGSLFGMSVLTFGSDEQRAQILPLVTAGQVVGSFALTEPESGSDIARGLATTARKVGSEWVINGTKRWIGNATWSDLAVVWARDFDDERRLLGFIVPTDTPGWRAEKIEGKYSLRTVQNAHITLDDVRVPASSLLPGVNSFREISEILKFTRLEVGWTALGNAVGAFDSALSYSTQRQQFGRPLAEFQLVQDLLVRVEVNIASSLGVLVQAARLADQGGLREEHASLVKLMAATQARDSVRLCRELLGGDGILIENKVMKHLMDAEAILTFEGTHQINSLIVGRSITGHSAFV